MSNLLWGIFEIAVNLYQGFVVLYFTFRYLGDKKDRKYFHSPSIAFAALLA